MVPTICAICGEPTPGAVLFPERLGSSTFGSDLFSARRRPDRRHYRMIRCAHCGLVRADPVLESERLPELYRGSHLSYRTEIPWLKKTYGEFLERFVSRSRRGALLEVGCGNGFFLEEALARGFNDVIGIEPSQEAKAAAAPAIREKIRLEMFRPGMFAAERFDVIVFFQVLDHLPRPQEAIAEAVRLLRREGMVLAINHDLGAWSAKLFGERSPIVDIEHTYLYDRKTMRTLFEKHGFEIQWLGAVANTYPIRYWLHLAPIPAGIKTAMERFLRFAHLDAVPLRFAAGNLGLVARKRTLTYGNRL